MTVTGKLGHSLKRAQIPTGLEMTRQAHPSSQFEQFTILTKVNKSQSLESTSFE